ncbi:demethylmenaquinone methyltransferase-like isoform X1 [Clavelina lepadiformis]|uniref:demethylmenaquinone methyltransferase-like isoform X1 n=1 Tax=Clavelina lepadiformis TaxID=159417 RepID=UPI004041EB67
MSQNEKETRISNIVSQLSLCAEHNVLIYDKCAREYDDLAEVFGFDVPRRIADYCMKNLSLPKGTTVKSCTALDVAAGTGITAEALKKAGFTGAIDGFDGSSEMVKVAATKQIHRTIVQHLALPNHPLPFAGKTYDVVVIGSAMNPGHVPHECLHDFLDLLKPGGILLFNVSHLTTTDPDGQASGSVRRILQDMSKEGKGECILDEMHPNIFKSDTKHHKFKGVSIHCFKKI